MKLVKFGVRFLPDKFVAVLTYNIQKKKVKIIWNAVVSVDNLMLGPFTKFNIEIPLNSLLLLQVLIIVEKVYYLK